MVSYKKKFDAIKERQLMQKARDCLERGEIEKGVDLLTKVISLNPNNVEALSRRLQVYYNMRQYDLAFADTEKALRLDPMIPDHHAVMASILYQKGDYDSSLAISTTALDILAKRNLPYGKVLAS